MNYMIRGHLFCFWDRYKFQEGSVCAFKESVAFLGNTYEVLFSYFAIHFPWKRTLSLFYSIFKCKFSLFLWHVESLRMRLAEIYLMVLSRLLLVLFQVCWVIWVLNQQKPLFSWFPIKKIKVRKEWFPG